MLPSFLRFYLCVWNSAWGVVEDYARHFSPYFKVNIVCTVCVSSHICVVGTGPSFPIRYACCQAFCVSVFVFGTQHGELWRTSYMFLCVCMGRIMPPRKSEVLCSGLCQKPRPLSLFSRTTKQQLNRSRWVCEVCRGTRTEEDDSCVGQTLTSRVHDDSVSY